MSFSKDRDSNDLLNKNIKPIKDLYYSLTDKERKKYALVEMNIKNFKYYNAKYGREYGDVILNKFHNITSEFIGNKGYVNHTYADNFHFFIEYTEDKNLEEEDSLLAGFLNELIDKLFFNLDSIIDRNVYVSFGIILPSSLNGDFDELINKLSIIRKGCPHIRSRAFSFEIYSEEKYNKYIKKLDLAKNLTSSRVNDEFDIYIQPKVNIHTEKIVGGEVLLRWNKNKEIGLNEYLPVLIEFEEIYLVDLNNFRKACKYIKEGIEKNEPRVQLSFNITNVALLLNDSYEQYISIIEEMGIDTKYIEFELLEDIKFESDKNLCTIIEEFRARDIKCSLDDFGTGNSSFAFLLNGYINSIKLDRMFFRGELTIKRKELIRNLFEIAKVMNVEVVAEGVEDIEYIDYLREVGCNVVQGYYYYKPMPLDEFQKLLDKQFDN